MAETWRNTIDGYITRRNAVDCFCHFGCGNTFCTDGYCNDVRQLLSIPVADVVEVVRCRDCKYRNMFTVEMWKPCNALVVPDDFSCICGERREDLHVETATSDSKGDGRYSYVDHFKTVGKDAGYSCSSCKRGGSKMLTNECFHCMVEDKKSIYWEAKE